MNENQMPVFATQIGSVRVAIWRQTKRDGKPFFTTSVVRRFRTEEGEWRDSQSFAGLGDLAMAAEGIRVAREWLTRRMLDESQGTELLSTEGDSDYER